jgi:hypothetical protein
VRHGPREMSGRVVENRSAQNTLLELDKSDATHVCDAVGCSVFGISLPASSRAARSSTKRSRGCFPFQWISNARRRTRRPGCVPGFESSPWWPLAASRPQEALSPSAVTITLLMLCGSYL